MNKIADLRQEYKLHSLDEKDVDKDPFNQFKIWFDEAVHASLPEPNAFTLSTADARGVPSARVVLLKGIEQGGFSFYTNYESAKACEINSNPHVSMTFLWLELERQLRINGMATKLSREDSEKYFQTRPRDSRIAAWASKQSSVIPDRQFLEDKMRELLKGFEDQEHIPLPDSWGGYIITPHTFEFWQGRPNRLHDRIRYRLGDTEWIIERLSP